MCPPTYSKWYLTWRRWNLIIETFGSFVFLACFMIGLVSMYVPLIPIIVMMIVIVAIWCLILAIILLHWFYKACHMLSHAIQSPTDTSEAVELSPIRRRSETYEDVVQSPTYINQACEQVPQAHTDINETREHVLQSFTNTDGIRMVEIML
ncbi:unnamed protein product [Larinioides sclopetarius]|uniref:Uncharacterized protein n=1 Tax=Larinioides sclopetarius TaxID=280406 RepID=A0AAV1ZKH1_9ARAC